MSLLRQIQSDLAQPNGDLPSVLRKCKILAARLGSNEFARWVDLELNGYPDSEQVPEYRKLGGTCFASFVNMAWQVNRQVVPWSFVPENFRNVLQYSKFKNGIATVTSFENGARIDQPELVIAIDGKVFPQMTCVAVWIEISSGALEQLLSAIKNRILDFVLRIEAENPDAGEAALHAHPIPIERLQPIENNFFGSIGNFAQNSTDFSQTANLGIQRQDLEKLVRGFTENIDDLQLDASAKQRAEAQVATLQAQLADEPDPLIVRQAGRTLRNVTEGAIGSLIATAAQPTIWHWIHMFLARLG